MQALAARLGIATGRDLAQACRDHFSRPVGFALWALCEIAIVACDLAEVIGSAIALQLLFHLPLLIGVLLTGADVLVILLLQRRGFRYLEAFVVALLAVIAASFAIEIALSRPDVQAVLGGFIPKTSTFTDPAKLYLAIGILGATVMPHNLYLHSSIVQTRSFERTDEGKREAARFATIDSTVALTLALFVNAAILIMAAAVFHTTGRTEVAEIGDAHRLLAPLLGTTAASVLFAVALLASGQNSTVTATLAGQVVMEGFLHIRLPPWLRRLVTRAAAIVPAVIGVALWGERGLGQLLVLSQVVLSLQLPFAVIPLVLFTSDRGKMGPLGQRALGSGAGVGGLGRDRRPEPEAPVRLRHPSVTAAPSRARHRLAAWSGSSFTLGARVATWTQTGRSAATAPSSSQTSTWGLGAARPSSSSTSCATWSASSSTSWATSSTAGG